jgi:trk system potassium uptake protein TrkH
MSGALIVAGAALIWLLEAGNSFEGLPFGEQLLASLFQSVTCRTAGFNTVDIAGLAPATLFVMIFLMFVGGCPGSCAGGVKTTTFCVLVLTAWTRLRNRSHVNAFGRTIAEATIVNTLSITLGGIAAVFFGAFLVLMLQQAASAGVQTHGHFVEYLFETVSALGTVGLSTGATASLTPLARLVVTFLMFLGRLGPLTVAAALARRDELRDWRYPEEDVMVG